MALWRPGMPQRHPLRPVPGGRSFPNIKNDGEWFYRTDLDILFFWSASVGQWLSVNSYSVSFGNYAGDNQPYANSTNMKTVFPHPTLGLYIMVFYADLWVNTTNDSSKYWTVTGASSVLSTQGSAINSVIRKSNNDNGLMAQPNSWLQVTVTKVSTPGTIFVNAGYSYRLWAT